MHYYYLSNQFHYKSDLYFQLISVILIFHNLFNFNASSNYSISHIPLLPPVHFSIMKMCHPIQLVYSLTSPGLMLKRAFMDHFITTAYPPTGRTTAYNLKLFSLDLTNKVKTRTLFNKTRQCNRYIFYKIIFFKYGTTEIKATETNKQIYLFVSVALISCPILEKDHFIENLYIALSYLIK